MQDLTAYFPLTKAKKAKLEENSCFVAGTLVHTRDGLLPIEAIKVGDWVLSKLDDGSGELEYKRVSRTFVHHDKETFLIKFHRALGSEQAKLIDPKDYESLGEWIAVTISHPFWVKQSHYTIDGSYISIQGWKESNWIHSDEEPFFLTHPDEPEKAGWVEVGNIGNGDLILTADGGYASARHITPIFPRGLGPDIGWAPFDHGDLRGMLVDFSKFPFGVTNEFCPIDLVPEGRGLGCTVYNIEVEFHHTYFVGRLGLWVHNKNINMY